MAALTQQAVESAVDAYLQRDAGLCQYVRQNETAINTAQRELDEMAYELLSLEQPMAIDLRFILAVIKINGDLERIGDQSVGIARRTREALEMDYVDLPVDMSAMGEYAARMIRTAIQALLEGDARLADTVREMDDEIDRANRRALERQSVATGQLVEDLESDVVPRSRVPGFGHVAETSNELHSAWRNRYSVSSSFSTLPFLMTSGSAGAAGAAAASAGAGSASTFGAIT